jgi:pimeloyl-ACP methyl ester carboxylesterase
MTTVTTNGVELHVETAGDPGGPAVLLAHGFPELAYSWRHQLPALAEAGYFAVAPDMRGYGRSSRPEPITDYDITHLTGDVAGVLDHFGIESAVIVGHDWGSIVASNFAGLYPSRTRALVNMSVPHSKRGPMGLITLLKQVFQDQFFYMLYFQEPGVADADLGADAAKTMRRMLAGVKVREGDTLEATGMASPDPSLGFVDRMPEPDGLPDWLTQEELDFYIGEFTRTGFTGGINWYRNLDRNWEITPQLDGAKVEVPSLFVAGRQDPVILMAQPSGPHDVLMDHRGDVLIDDAGHWVQQEKAAETNEALINFLKGIT